MNSITQRPVLYFPDEPHLSKQHLRDALPEDDGDLQALVQELLELKDGVQSVPL